MKKNNIKISYDPEADVLSWEADPDAKIDYAAEVGNFIIHFSEDNRPIIVEILEASKIMKRSEKTIERARELAHN